MPVDPFVEPLFTHNLCSSAIRRGRWSATSLSVLFGSNSSARTGFPCGHHFLKQSSHLHHLSPHTLSDQHLKEETMREIALLLKEHPFWIYIWPFVLSPQMSCVPTWRFKLIGLSPTAPVMVLNRCQVCAKCCLSNGNTGVGNTCTPQSARYFQKHFLHSHFPFYMKTKRYFLYAKT